MSHRDEVETVVHSDNDFATVAYLRIKKASLQPKTSPSTADSLDVTVPPVLTEAFSDLRDMISNHASSHHRDASVVTDMRSSVSSPDLISRKLGRWVAVANVQRNLCEQQLEVSLEDEVRECFETLKGGACC